MTNEIQDFKKEAYEVSVRDLTVTRGLPQHGRHINDSRRKFFAKEARNSISHNNIINSIKSHMKAYSASKNMSLSAAYKSLDVPFDLNTVKADRLPGLHGRVIEATL